MGSSCTKNIQRFFGTDSDDWPKVRPQLFERRVKLSGCVDDLSKKESSLRSRQYALMAQSNATTQQAKRRVEQFGASADLSQFTIKNRDLGRELDQVNDELEMTSQSIRKMDAVLRKINSLILYQDAVHNIGASMEGMENLGINGFEFEKYIQNAARTTDALDILATSVGDRFATMSNAEESSEDRYTLNVNRLPFPHIAIDSNLAEGECTPLVSFNASDLKHDTRLSAYSTPAGTTPATPMTYQKRTIIPSNNSSLPEEPQLL